MPRYSRYHRNTASIHCNDKYKLGVARGYYFNRRDAEAQRKDHLMGRPAESRIREALQALFKNAGNGKPYPCLQLLLQSSVLTLRLRASVVINFINKYSR